MRATIRSEHTTLVSKSPSHEISSADNLLHVFGPDATWLVQANSTLFVDEGAEDHGLWMLQRDLWRRVSLFPDKPPADDGTTWYFAERFGNDSSPIMAFAHDNLGPGIAFLIKLNDRGEPPIVNSWPGDSSEFETAFLRTSDDVILKTVDRKLFVWREK